MRGISFVPTKELSKEAKEKLEKLEVKRQSRLNKIVEDYKKNNSYEKNLETIWYHN